MQLELMTQKMVDEFKREILDEIKKLSLVKSEDEIWLRTQDVIKILGCSEGTLVNLRASGKLPYAKINGSLYYRKSDVLNMLNSSIVA